MCPLVFLVSSRRGSGFKHQHMTVTLPACSASHSSKVPVDCRDTRLVSAFEGLAIRGGYCNVPLHHMTIRLAHLMHAAMLPPFPMRFRPFRCASAYSALSHASADVGQPVQASDYMRFPYLSIPTCFLSFPHVFYLIPPLSP